MQPEYVVETGTCWGACAEAIGRALERNGHGRLDTLEPDPRRAEVARSRCEGLPVTVHEVRSLEFVPAAPIDIAWLDSLLELRVPEYHYLRPWMRPGTVVGFHDTAPHHGVYGSHVRALPGVGIIHLRTPRGVTFAQVKED
jgi:predicted O-methyltransferase YrrM